MKLLLQLAVIFGVYWASQWIEALLPFSFPASVISLVLLLVLLLTGLVKHEHVRDVSDFILGNLVFFFIPVAVSIMNYVEIISANLIAFATICVVSLLLTYAVTSFAVTWTRRLMEKRGGEK